MPVDIVHHLATYCANQRFDSNRTALVSIPLFLTRNVNPTTGVGLTFLAEGVGFEPTVPLPARLFSRQVP